MRRAHGTIFAMLLAASTLWSPRSSQAMEIRMFDDMAMQDQVDYLEFLVKTAQQVLVEHGQKDLAAKVDRLFHAAQPDGRGFSLGEEHFHRNLGDTRAHAARNPHAAARANIEFVLMTTLVENGIRPPLKFSRDFAQILKNKPFWPKAPLQRN